MSLPKESSAWIHFGVFSAELRTGELRRDGVKVRIQQLPFRALTVLLGSPGEVISREDLRRKLWPEDVFVDFDQGISSAIRRLRDALGDSADNPVFIETVERRGYRWIAPIQPSQPAALPAEPQEKQGTGDVAATALKPFPWRQLLFVIPLLALLFAVWIFHSGYRDAKANAKSSAMAPAGGPHPANREAEDYYLKGRFYWNKRTPESLNQAVDSFTQAIVHDPNYANAYVGLADCYNLLREYTVMPASEAYPRALAAAKKAVELDDRSSDAHASLAFASFYGMWDAGTADQEFRRALELDPNNAKAHHWYATFLATVRRFNESLIEINRAQALDPNSSSVVADKGMLLWRAGSRDESLRLLQQVEQAYPDAISPHRYLKMVYFEMGDYTRSLNEMNREAALLHDSSASAIAKAAERGFATDGVRGMFKGQLDQQKKAYTDGRLSPFFLAETYARMDNPEQALTYLDACYDRRSDETVNAAVDPAFDSMRSLPAFRQFLLKVGLPSEK